jgi:endonuclease YncB( thermonuclease family)
VRRAAPLLALAGLLGVAVAVYALAPVAVPPETIEAVAKPEAQQPAVPAAAERFARVRPVAPDTVAQPEVAPEELVRVEPRQPLSTFAAPTRKRRNHGRLYRPLIHAAGQVSGSGIMVDLAGVVPTLADETCRDAAGTEWPCGARARTAFRSFVRGRAMACDLPEEITEKRYVVPCSIGKQDVGAWLVAQGWARAAPGSDYVAMAEAARAAGKGIFGAAPVIEPLPDPEPVAATDLFPAD